MNDRDKSEIKDFLKKLLKKKQGELSEISYLIDSIDKNSIGEDEFERKIKKYITDNERNFLYAKELSLYLKLLRNQEIQTANIYEKLGSSDFFDAKLIKSEYGYHFILPHFASKETVAKRGSDGKYITSLIIRLLGEYEKSKPIFIKPTNDLVVIFEHHIDKNSKRMMLLDGDNVDIKSATDALFGYLIEDDNLINLWQMQYSVLDEKNFCIMHIIKKSDFKKWIEENKFI